MLALTRRGMAGVVALYSGVALAGWIFRLPALTSFGVGAAQTSLATAACAILLVIAVIAQEQDNRAGRRFARTIGCGLVAAISLVAMGQYALDLKDAGYLMGPTMGRYSPATAVSFLFLSGAVYAIGSHRHYLGASLAVGALTISGSAIIGYAYDVAALTQVLGFSAMAFPTALVVTLLALAILMLDPKRGWLRHIAMGPQARSAFQLMMPVAVIAPFAIGGLANWLVGAGLVGTSFGFAAVAVIMIITLGAMVVVTSAQLGRINRTEARLVAIVESSDDAIIGKNLDGIITSWNRGGERLFGFTAREAIGRPMQMLIPDERADEEAQILAKIHRKEHVDHFETVRRRKDGSMLDVSITVSPILLASGTVIGASSIIRDISARKLKDLELERSNAELEQFAYVASHDLQEPLRMVANYVELLSQRYTGQLDERADKFIHYASDGARRMQQLVSDLLAYSRVGSQGRPPVRVETNAVVDRVVHTLQRRLEECGGAIERDELPRVLGDEVQLTQLFQNLVGNALKFRGDEPPRVRVHAEVEGRQVRFAVSDNGIGMEMRFAERIFQMFQRLHERSAFEGSGIGLAISKRIVERHGGSIWVESEPGAGTTFFFTLPADQ